MGMWFNCGFFMGLRGEEMIRIEFFGDSKECGKVDAAKCGPIFHVGGDRKVEGKSTFGGKILGPVCEAHGRHEP
jgi:hypothetical protein